MATHLGKEGVVKVGLDTVAEVRSWTLATSVDTVDASHLGDDWKIHRATQKSWHGSLACFWDASDIKGQGALAIGETVALTLYFEGDSPPPFSGSALVTGIDYNASHSGLIEANVTFQGTGALNQRAANPSKATSRSTT